MHGKWLCYFGTMMRQAEMFQWHLLLCQLYFLFASLLVLQTCTGVQNRVGMNLQGENQENSPCTIFFPIDTLLFHMISNNIVHCGSVGVNSRPSSTVSLKERKKASRGKCRWFTQLMLAKENCYLSLSTGYKNGVNFLERGNKQSCHGNNFACLSLLCFNIYQLQCVYGVGEGMS